MIVKPNEAPSVEPRISIPTQRGYELIFQQAVFDAIKNGEMPLVAGIDVGYNTTKAFAWGLDAVKFKTIYGYGRDLGHEVEKISKQHPGEQITLDNTQWFVGQLAARHLQVNEHLLLRGRENVHDIRVLMIIASIGKLLKGLYSNKVIRVQLTIGLPVTHMKDAAKLKELLIGRHLIDTDAAKFPVEIEAVAVMPQPDAVINAYSLLPNGEENPAYTFYKVGVADNGGYTIDTATEEDGTFIRAGSGTKESGLYLAYDRVGELYQSTFNEQPSERQIEKILLARGKFNAYGTQEFDWSREVERELKPCRDATIELCRESFKSGAELEIIFHVGGPAPLFHDDVRMEYPHAIMPANSQDVIALGYLHYAWCAAQPE